jgi:hypothetical protein
MLLLTGLFFRRVTLWLVKNRTVSINYYLLTNPNETSTTQEFRP